jgi:uncharacterized RDD family membrane protein YckC
VTMDQSGGSAPPPPPAQQPPPPPPPQQGWQSTPTPPGPPPAGGGQPSGLPSWTNNLTDRSTPAGPGGIALADAPNRIIALVIDFVILGIIGFIVNVITTAILGDQFVFLGVASGRYASFTSSLVAVILMLVVVGAYFVLTWTRMDGATVGMRVLKLSVRDAATGGPITQSQAITRFIFLGAPYALEFFYGWGIGFIISILVLVYYIYLLYSVANDPLRQGLHDKQAKTVVAKLAA